MTFSPLYDLEQLSEQERQEYVTNLCDYLGIAPNLGLIRLSYLNDPTGGPSRLVAWIKRAGTEQIRAEREISVIETSHDILGDTIIFKVTGKDKNGRQEIGIGAKTFSGLTGDAKEDAIMTSHTRASRRMTLQFAGAGLLDESEVHGRVVNPPTGAVSKLTLAESKPNNSAGKDVTLEKIIEIARSFPDIPPSASVTGSVNAPDLLTVMVDMAVEAAATELMTPEQKQASWEEGQRKMREDAIAQLNGGAEAPPIEKKTRKPRQKKTIDMGPSEPVPVAIVAADKPEPPAATVPAPAPVEPVAMTVPPPVQPVATGTPAVAGKPRLTPEQVKPYRQRLFRVVNDYLEPNGFAPKEGMGNADKMRALATIQFPDVMNMNELTTTQWESYLTSLEQRIQKEGAAETVKYIEDQIGI